MVALAGPNGAGKTTFYEAHLKDCGLRFLNADILAGELGTDAYQGAEIAAKLTRARRLVTSGVHIPKRRMAGYLGLNTTAMRWYMFSVHGLD